MARVAHQQQQGLEGFGWKGQNLAAAAQNTFAGQQAERAESIGLRFRRPGTGLTFRNGDLTRRIRRRPWRVHEENIRFRSGLPRSTPVILYPCWSGSKSEFQTLDPYKF